MLVCKRKLTSLALICQAAVSIPARAEDLPADNGRALERGRLMVVEGKRGQWWPLETAFVLAAEHQELAETRKLLTQYEVELDLFRTQLDLKDKRIQQLTLAGGLSEARALAAEQAINHAEMGRVAAEQRAKDAESRLSSWWRHLALWAGVGVLIGAGTVVLVRAK